MRVQLFKTGDPWMDWGLLAFASDLEGIFARWKEDGEEIETKSSLHSSFFEFTIPDEEVDYLREKLVESFRERLNQLLLPPIELRLLIEFKLRKDYEKKEDGFYDESFQVTLTKEEIEFLKKDSLENGEKKPFLKNPNKKVEMGNARNFIGLKNDWRALKGTFEEEIDYFFMQHQKEMSKKAKACPLCNRQAETKMFYSMNQVKNFLLNQHHAVPVRGFLSTVGKEKMCPTCNLLCLYGEVEVHSRPYFLNKKQVTHLFIPQSKSLVDLRFVMNQLKKQLIDLRSESNLVSYSTNIKNLSHRSLYVSLLTIYHLLNQVDEKEEDPINREALIHSLQSWFIPRLSKSTNVIFKEVYKVSVDERIFQITEPIRFGNKREGNVVEQFFGAGRVEDDQTLDQLAKAIFKLDRQKIARGLFEWLKQAVRNPQKNHLSIIGCLFFEDYIGRLNQIAWQSNQKAEVKNVISGDLQEKLKTLGRVIGTHFSSNLSVLTKLNMASSVDHFKEVLNEVFFRLVKMTYEKRKSNESVKNMYMIKDEDLHALLSELEEKNNFREIHTTLMLYTNLNAFRALKYKEEKKDV